MYLTFDVGTTSMKTCVFDREFTLIFSHTAEYDLLYPEKNRVELPAEQYWQALKRGIAAALAAGISGQQLRVITITTQGETLIPVDRGGNPLTNAIIWLDSRAEAEAAALNAALEPDAFFRTTGMTELTGATPIAKLMWLRLHRPEVFAQTHRFLLLEDYLIYRLTDSMVSEHSLLSSTGYLDILKNEYWEQILDLAGIPRQLLNPILPCGTRVSGVSPEAAAQTGLSAGTPVATGAMDQIAGALGAGNICPGVITETTGTCLALGATAKVPDFDAAAGKFSIYRHFDEQYIYLPYDPTAAIILKWFKENFMRQLAVECEASGESVYGRMDQLAELSGPGAKGLLLIPHFSGKLVPEGNPDAKGVFYGVGLDTTPADFIRAILESVGFMLRENLESLRAAGIPVREVRALGGGSRSDLWMQIKADICQTPFIRTGQSEATSLGAAMLGALALGDYPDARTLCDTCGQTERVFLPDRPVYEGGYQKYLALYEALKPIFAME